MKFYIVRLLIEAGLLFHLFWRLRLAWGGGRWQWPVVALLLFVMFSLWGWRNLSLPAGLHSFLGDFGPLALSYLIFFFLISFGLDLLRLAIGLLGSISGHSWWKLLAAAKSVPLALILTFAIVGYSYYQVHHPKIVEIEIASADLPDSLDGLRLVHLTDIHISQIYGTEDLKQLATLVNQIDADILLFTGDMLDRGATDLASAAQVLKTMIPPLGAYAILGNHEAYYGEKVAVEFFHAAGWHLLRGEAKLVNNDLVVVGVDDEVFGRGTINEAGELLRTNSDDGRRFALLLKHRPSLAPNSAGAFDLQLSGHTHGGQIWPAHYLAKRANSGMLYGLYDVPEGGKIYVSRGAGFWGFPVRFLAPPDITVIELTK